MVPARADLGIHTQPISFTGLPALSVPLHRPGRLPLGLQLVGGPDGEALFRFAAGLEARERRDRGEHAVRGGTGGHKRDADTGNTDRSGADAAGAPPPVPPSAPPLRARSIAISR